MLDLPTFQDLATSKLESCLQSTGSMAKCLVLDAQLGVLPLIWESLKTQLSVLVYFVKPAPMSLNFFHRNVKVHQHKRISVFFVPRKTLFCEEYLKNAGVYGNLYISECDVDFFPLNREVLSLESRHAFRECVVEGDSTVLYNVARFIMKLQSTYGLISHICGAGLQAKQVADVLSCLQKESYVFSDIIIKEDEKISEELDTIVLLDRCADLVTPLCTQLTYEGLLSEVFQVEGEKILLPVDILPTDLVARLPANQLHYEFLLDFNDPVYNEIRDSSFPEVGPRIRSRAKAMEAAYQKRHTANTVDEVREFVKQLKEVQEEHRSLSIHTSIAEKIICSTADPCFSEALRIEKRKKGVCFCSPDLQLHCAVFTVFIDAEGTDKFNESLETLICRCEPFLKVLRLICLQSVINGGLRQKILEQYMSELVQTYGSQHLQTLYNLQKAGLLSLKAERSYYSSVKKRLKLVVPGSNEKSREDISYVYGGYAPLSVRLVEWLQHTGAKSPDAALASFAGPFFHVDQRPKGARQQTSLSLGGVAQPDFAATAPKTTLVFYLGGCTSAEISALRLLSSRARGLRRYLVATTSIITGDALLSTLEGPFPC
ncbi:vacuolar protein sorting-associated protein 33A-like isoform X3 [Zophobas morio]|uniref:vacuolar protein sorting-associated protein 33A-like isoform X3 n=1 Tax=Zophobas morio TaxID=2755281 RepID=UPI003083E2F5